MAIISIKNIPIFAVEISSYIMISEHKLKLTCIYLILMKVSAKWVDGYTFIASGETNHYTVMDASYESQTARASTPNELLLQAMAGCTGMDIVSILKI